MKRRPREAIFALAVMHSRGRVLLGRRSRDGLLGGMWAFPEREISDAERAQDSVLQLASERGLPVAGEPVPLPPCSHRFTHLHASYLPFALEVEGTGSDESSEWIDVDRPTRLALPTAQQRVLESFRRGRVSSRTTA